MLKSAYLKYTIIKMSYWVITNYLKRANCLFIAKLTFIKTDMKDSQLKKQQSFELGGFVFSNLIYFASSPFLSSEASHFKLSKCYNSNWSLPTAQWSNVTNDNSFSSLDNVRSPKIALVQLKLRGSCAEFPQRSSEHRAPARLALQPLSPTGSPGGSDWGHWCCPDFQPLQPELQSLWKNMAQCQDSPCMDCRHSCTALPSSPK